MGRTDTFRRGFKAEAERIAAELRGELELAVHERLDPARLAKHLLVPVLTLEELVPVAPEAARYLLGPGRGVFSAVTIHVTEFARAIVTNSAHAVTRQMSSLCHEISHIVLDHEAEEPHGLDGTRVWNPTQEREADWLAGCLLIPHDAAHGAARKGLTNIEVAEKFGVSEALATWRMNHTGARIRARRRRRFP